MEGGLEKWKNRYRGMRGWPLPGRAQAHRWSPLLPPQFFRVGLRTLLSTTTTTTPNPQKGIPFSKKAGIPEAHSKGTTIPGIWNPTLYGISPYRVRGSSALIWNYGVAPGISQTRSKAEGEGCGLLAPGSFAHKPLAPLPTFPLILIHDTFIFIKKQHRQPFNMKGQRNDTKE